MILNNLASKSFKYGPCINISVYFELCRPQSEICRSEINREKEYYLGVVGEGFCRPLELASQTELATVLPMDVITCIKSNLKHRETKHLII